MRITSFLSYIPILASLFNPAAAQDTATAAIPTGSINGRPIPAKVFSSGHVGSVAPFMLEHGREPGGPEDEKEIQARMHARICQDLRGEIDRVARDEAIRDLGIVVTKEDLEKARLSIPVPDPVKESSSIREHAGLMISALSAVSDRGQDQHQVYLDMLQPTGVSEAEWYSYREQWKTPKGRATITRRMTFTPDVIAGQIAATNLTLMVAGEKLEEAVDRDISAREPQFGSALHEYQLKVSDPDPKRRGVPEADMKYLNGKRMEWWKARHSKMRVVLSDSSLAKGCGLAQIGVQAVVQ